MMISNEIILKLIRKNNGNLQTTLVRTVHHQVLQSDKSRTCWLPQATWLLKTG